MGDWTVSLEHGIGAKLDFMPFTNNQNYQIFGTPGGPSNRTARRSRRSRRGIPALGGTGAAGVDVPAPRPHRGEVPEDVELRPALPLHLDARRQLASASTRACRTRPTRCRARRPDPGQHGGPRRRGALQRRRVRRRIPRVLAHRRAQRQRARRLAGGRALAQRVQLQADFFGRRYNPHTGIYNGPQNETGTVDNVGLQYSFSFGALRALPEDWWGDGPDLVADRIRDRVDRRQHGAARSRSAGRRAAHEPGGASRATWDMSTKKLKMGFDAVYTPLYWLGVNGRFDWVRPDMDTAYSRTTFSTQRDAGQSRRIRPELQRAHRAPGDPDPVRHPRDGAARSTRTTSSARRPIRRITASAGCRRPTPTRSRLSAAMWW